MELANPSTRTSRVFTSYTHYLSIRKEHSAFNPLAPQQVLDLGSQVFALLRTAEGQGEKVLCLINITNSEVELHVDPTTLDSSIWVDLINGMEYHPGKINLEPYQVLWLI